MPIPQLWLDLAVMGLPCVCSYSWYCRLTFKAGFKIKRTQGVHELNIIALKHQMLSIRSAYQLPPSIFGRQRLCLFWMPAVVLVSVVALCLAAGLGGGDTAAALVLMAGQ